MGHAHTLHRQIDVECACCRVIQEFTFKSSSDLVICRSCERHQGDTQSKTHQRDFDHLNLWSSELRLLEEQRLQERRETTEKVAKLQARLTAASMENESLRDAVRAGLSDTSPADIQRILQDQAVMDAQQERDASYRSRDRAYSALWAVDELHHRDSIEGEYCSCGSRANACAVLAALDPHSEALRRWERAQIERSKARKPHGLPREHPDYSDWRAW